jgi:hypothetical protein
MNKARDDINVEEGEHRIELLVGPGKFELEMD